MAPQAMQMSLKYIMSKKYFRQGRELENGSVWGGPIISLALSQGAPKGHNLVLNITVVISDGIDLTQRLFNICIVLKFMLHCIKMIQVWYAYSYFFDIYGNKYCIFFWYRYIMAYFKLKPVITNSELYKYFSCLKIWNLNLERQ